MKSRSSLTASLLISRTNAHMEHFCIVTVLRTMVDEALALFKEMDELNYASNVLNYNSLISLYLKIGKLEKVPYLVEEMKKRNIQLTNHTYYFWIQSQKAVNLEGVEQIMQEVEKQDSLKEDWSIYSNLASVYTEFGQLEKAITAWNKVGELLDKTKQPCREGYHFQILGYAKIGNLESVYQVWHKLKSRYKTCINISYLAMLQALSTLDDIEGLTKCLKEWESSGASYDDRLPTAAIEAYLRHDMLEEAEELLKDVIERDNGTGRMRKVHIVFMKHYLEKHQFVSALKHIEAAIAAGWKPPAENLEPFFQHFIEEKDVDSAEEFCRKLEVVQALDSKTYLWLLQTYVASGKTAPDMRQRMERNSVDISTEHEDLFQKIC